MAKKKTKSNTAPTYTRNANVITASWVKQSTAYGVTGLQYDYCTKANGAWGSWGGWKDLNGNTTSIPFTFTSMAGSMQALEVKTRIRGCNKNGDSYAWSDPTSSVYYTYAPPTPSLSVTKNSANSTTFSWSTEVDDTGQYPFYTCYYSTYNGTSWSSWTACGASGSLTYTDSATNFYRQFVIYSTGWGGNSATASGLHFIGTAPSATWSASPVSITNRGSYYDMTYNVNLTAYEDQVDEITPQYYIGEPTATMQCPSGASWGDGASRTFNSSGAYALPITTDSIIGEDECLWARVKTAHDGTETRSNVYRVLTGKLSAPEATFTMGSVTVSGFSVTINITDAGTSVPAAYIEVYLERRSRAGRYEKIGTIANGTSSATISSSIDLTHEEGLAIHIRNVTSDGHSMMSDFCSYRTSMPARPTLNSVTQDADNPDKVFVSWTQNWAKANGTIIAWTDDPDNWMSNNEPSTFEVKETTSGWYIVGLETGKTWYFRVRSVFTEEDSVTYTSWSNEIDVDLSSAPAIPVLYLSEEVITENGMVSAYWVYSTTDGTPQVSADIAEMRLSSGAWVENRLVTAVSSAQHVDIYAKSQGWNNGDTVYLSLRTRSGSGRQSEYSTPSRLLVAEKPTVAISSTSLVNGMLTALPFNVTVTTTARDLTLVIERAVDYPMIRPDGTETAGAKGETIYVSNIRANSTNNFVINLADLIGVLDDGASYNVIATASDKYGQKAKASTKFKVNWSRQAWIPSATIVTDANNMIARITPTAGASYDEGDTCDIYRISIDGYELVYAGAQFGTEYVDPYPAFGEFSGYKIVTITSNGDYITGNNTFAEYDTTDGDEYTQLNSKMMVIDFDGNRLELQYNVDFSSNFEKDFKETKYLGGAVRGDWNKSLSRTVEASSVTVPVLEEGLMQMIRKLAMHSGVCHVRTPDGSSYSANVDVSDAWSYNTRGMVRQISLSITRIDAIGYDGMTYEEWST